MKLRFGCPSTPFSKCRRLISCLVGAWLLMAFPIAQCAALAKALEVVDDSGRTIILDRPAARIVALYGAYNEILAAMGLVSRIVGRTKTRSTVHLQ